MLARLVVDLLVLVVLQVLDLVEALRLVDQRRVHVLPARARQLLLGLAHLRAQYTPLSGASGRTSGAGTAVQATCMATSLACREVTYPPTILSETAWASIPLPGQALSKRWRTCLHSGGLRGRTGNNTGFLTGLGSFRVLKGMSMDCVHPPLTGGVTHSRFPGPQRRVQSET